MVEQRHDARTGAVHPGKVSVLLLTGTTGSGKTAVAGAIGEMFPPTRAIVTVDLDQLGWAFIPDAPNERIAKLRSDNLAAIWPNLLSAGFQHVVVSGVISTSEQLGRIREATAASDLIVVRLVTPRPLLRERLMSRDSGRLLDDHLSMMPLLDEAMDRSMLEGFQVLNDHRTVREVATEVLRTIGWTEVRDSADPNTRRWFDASRSDESG